MAAKKTAGVERAERRVVLRERDVVRFAARFVAACRGKSAPDFASWFNDLQHVVDELGAAKWKAMRARSAARKAAR